MLIRRNKSRNGAAPATDLENFLDTNYTFSLLSCDVVLKTAVRRFVWLNSRTSFLAFTLLMSDSCLAFISSDGMSHWMEGPDTMPLIGLE